MRSETDSRDMPTCDMYTLSAAQTHTTTNMLQLLASCVHGPQYKDTMALQNAGCDKQEERVMQS